MQKRDFCTSVTVPIIQIVDIKCISEMHKKLSSPIIFPSRCEILQNIRVHKEKEVMFSGRGYIKCISRMYQVLYPYYTPNILYIPGYTRGMIQVYQGYTKARFSSA